MSLVDKQIDCASVTDMVTGNQCVLHNNSVEGELELSETEIIEVADHIARFKSGVLSSNHLFVRVYSSPLKLIVVGAVHISQTLIPLAQKVGFNVIVIDPRKGFVDSAGFQNIELHNEWPDEVLKTIKLDKRTALVTLTHDTKFDDPALISALNSNAFYIGALGSQKTHAKRIKRLSEQGVNDLNLKRIYGPVGLDISAITPAEIAVSIISQIVKVYRAT